MGMYINSSLIKDEEVVYEGSFSLWDNFIWTLLSFGSFLPIMWLYQKFTEIAVTNKRVVGKKGIIRRTTYDYPLNRVESIFVKQSLLGRIFDFGDVVITGTGSSSLLMPSVKSPEKFRKQVYLTKEKIN